MNDVRKWSVIMLIMILGPTIALGQRVYINSIDQTTTTTGRVVTISGSGFSSTASNLDVFFGGAKGYIQSSTDNVIEVTPPPGATHDEIFVVNKSTRSSGASGKFFGINFGGASLEGSTDEEVQALFEQLSISTNQNLLYDLCMCDFDGDSLLDVAVTAQQDGSSRAKRLIYLNTSTPSTTSFSLAASLGNQPSSHTNCKDLNMDGKPDLVFSEIEVESEGDAGFEEIEVWLNNSTNGSINFGSSPAFAEDFLKPARDSDGNIRFPIRLELEDVDNDGLPDIIMSNNSDEAIDIFLNKSSGGTLSFETTPQQISIPTGSGYQARGIKLADFNNDLLIDIIIVPFAEDEFFVLQNESVEDKIDFKTPITYSVPGEVFRNAEVGDFDKDGFTDMAITSDDGVTPGTVQIYRNTTSEDGQDISFGTRTPVTVGISPWGIATGDIDGDGDVDIVSSQSDRDETTISYLSNTSSSGTISFSKKSIDIGTGNNSRNIKIGDINGDSKPDILATAKSLSNTAGTLVVLTNRSCATPTVTPGSDLYCNGITFELEATRAPAVTYTWNVTGGAAPTDTDSILDISTYNSTLGVTVTMATDDGKCSETSASQTYTINTNNPPTPNITLSANPVCSNDTLVLNTSVTADNYLWSGPGDYSSSEKSPSIPAEAVNAGTYGLKVFNNGGCKSAEVDSIITVISTPFPKVSNEDVDDYCIGGSATLFTASYSGYSLQWNKDGSAISGSTSTSIEAESTGQYSVTLTDNTNDCESTSVSYLIQEVSPPQPSISADTAICVDLQLDMDGDTVSGRTDFGLTYNWSFVNSSNVTVGSATTEDASNTFTTPDTYTLNLTTAYVDVANCSASTTLNVRVQAVPDYNISANFPDLIKCYEDTAIFTVQEDLVSYDWDTEDSTNFLTTDTSNFVSLVTPNEEDFVDVNVTMVDDVGCTIYDTIRIRNFTDENILITSPDMNTPVDNQELIIPIDYLHVELQAEEGSEFMWSPAEDFDDSTATNVTLYPSSSETEVILTGLDNNGCLSEYRITVRNQNLVARKSFSPNGDGLGYDCWEFFNISRVSGCTLYIFDQRGKIIFERESFDSDCVWDGTASSGAPVPTGVYFYVLKCDESENIRKGSILLAR